MRRVYVSLVLAGFGHAVLVLLIAAESGHDVCNSRKASNVRSALKLPAFSPKASSLSPWDAKPFILLGRVEREVC